MVSRKSWILRGVSSRRRSRRSSAVRARVQRPGGRPDPAAEDLEPPRARALRACRIRTRNHRANRPARSRNALSEEPAEAEVPLVDAGAGRVPLILPVELERDV